ncbi:MAG: L-rhamnose/proton symporter RhaT, partial [Bacteroidota bacterium]
MGAFIGVVLHAVGGFAAGSFYIPIKKVKDWSWESSWLVLGASAWLIVPIIIGTITIPDLWKVIGDTSSSTIFWTYFFGVLWGVGGLTFGLSMRYLGISLGMAIALGFCAAFGTLIPPIYNGTFGDLFANRAGWITFLGVMVCLVGIGVCGKAGMMKDKELDADDQQATVEEFNLGKGLVVALISGILSACFAFALEAGGEISENSLIAGADSLYQNNASLVIILLGGLTSNLIYCVVLNVRNKSYTNYTDGSKSLPGNYFWASLGGLTWYLQFFFYGMGSTLLGEKFDFASWT